MAPKNKVDFNYNSGMGNFYNEVKKTLVQQPDFKGIGGHGTQNHGGHGTHSQTSIGIGNSTANFRALVDDH